MKIFGREPALWLATLAAVLGLVVAFGWGALSNTQAAAIVASVSAVSMAAASLFTRPAAPALFTAAVTAVADLLAAFHYDLSQATIGAVNTLVITVLALLVRTQVSPDTGVLPR